MADVQKENGYTAIANELLEAICNSGFSAMELKVILTIARFTYGYSQKENEMSLGFIANFMKYKDRAGVSRAVTRLIKSNVIRLVGTHGQSRVLSLNKDYDTWNLNCCRNDNCCQNDNRTVAKMTTEVLSKQQQILYKENLKENNKDIIYTGCCQNDNTTPKQDDFTEEFEKLWSMYPKKRGKNKISKKAVKELKAAGFDTVAKAIDNYKSEIQKHHTSEQYIMHGSTFFNGSWRDFAETESEVTTNADSKPSFKPSTGFKEWEEK